jgi:hypothetical protein
MINKPLIFLTVLFSFSVISAQDRQELKGQYFLGPDIGLMFGTVNRIEVAPVLGYYLSNRLSVAAGFKYEFYSEKNLYTTYGSVKTHIYGPRAFMRFAVFNNIGDYLPVGMNSSIFMHAEFESNNLSSNYFYNPAVSDNSRFWHSTILLGGGFSQTASERIQINILFLWDTYTGSISLYNNPIIRFSLQFFLRPRNPR